MIEEHQLLYDSLCKHVALSSNDLALILEGANQRKYKKGQFIVHEGALVRKTHFLRKGLAITYALDANGIEHLIQFATEGWWISDIHSYVHGGPALYNVQAIEDCELYEFSYDNMQRIYQQVPAMASYFLSITQNAFAAFQERTLQNLSLDATQRYLNFTQKYPKVVLRLPQKHIASYLGMSAEFLSKIKKKQL